MLTRAKLVGRPDPQNVLHLDLGAAPLVRMMEQHGIRVSLPALSALGSKLESATARVDHQLRSLTGRDLDTNFNSDDQVADLLFSDPPGGLGLSAAGLKRTKVQGRPSVSTDELEKIAKQHPAVPLLIERSEYSKLISSYVNVIPALVDPRDWRLHDHFKQTSVVSGRFASKMLLTIPSRTDLGREVRAAFIPYDGYVFAEVDMSQAEFRCAAHDSRSKAMLNVFASGDDLHWLTSESVLGRPRPKDPKNPQPGELTKDDRYAAKRAGFGVLYGVTAPGLQTQIVVNGGLLEEWPESRCQQWIDGFYNTYDGLPERIEEHHYRARRFGLVWDWFGRVRYIPEVRSVHPAIIAAGLREAQNFGLAQAPAAGLLKMGMAAIIPAVEKLNKRGKRCYPLVPTHDSLLFELSPDIAEEFMGQASHALNNTVKLRCPLESDYTVGAVGDSWADVKG